MGGELRLTARRVLFVSATLALVAALVCPFVGGMGMDYAKLWRREAPDWNILVNLRLPRMLLALLAGAALSAAGALFQALLRNALATPSNLGVTAAASLGAVLAISFAPPAGSGFWLVWASALAAALLVMGLVAMLGRQRLSPWTLLLTGIAVNGICAALVLLLHSLAGITKSFQITHWLMGGVDAAPYPVLGLLALVVVTVCLFLLSRARLYNVVSYGEQWAVGRGVDYRQLSWQGYLAGTLMVGTTTAVTGPIAFVGLIVPHLLRRLVGPDYRLLLPASMFAGAAFLVVCDTVSRTVLAPVEIPVGVTTALMGGPFLVWLLWKR